MEPRNYSYEEFPEAQVCPAGMKHIRTDREEVFTVYEHDVPYIDRDGLLLHLQLLRPAYADWERKGQYPCIVFIQGSAWRKQNVYINIPNLAKLSQRGFVVAVVEYRPSDIAPFPAQIIDAKTAIRFLRKQAERFRIDPTNLFVMGDSSGAHTAVMAGITAEMPALDSTDFADESTQVNAIVDFYGPTDITRMNDVPSTMDHIAPESPEGMLIGGKNVLEHTDEAQKTNPINYIAPERAIPPMLILHGGKDQLVPFHQSVLLFEALKAAGKEVEFYQLQGAQHGGPQFWTDEVLDIVESFLRNHMPS